MTDSLFYFEKYHGAGNDFIMTDQRGKDISRFTIELVKGLCDRHFGIGADGLILLTESNKGDFKMIYFNSDGLEGTMCGNGGRCITAFAEKLGIIEDKADFEGIDGFHIGTVKGNGIYSLKMKDVSTVMQLEDGDFIDTGSAHFVQFMNDIHEIDVYNLGKNIRQQERFGPKGTNVNFIQIINKNEIKIRTFERGVENETLACGTGSVASAISAYLHHKTDKTSYLVHAPGGDLIVDFKAFPDNYFTDIWLTGPAEFVFSGNVKVD